MFSVKCLKKLQVILFKQRTNVSTSRDEKAESIYSTQLREEREDMSANIRNVDVDVIIR